MSNAPLITNDTIVFGLLMMTLGFIFYTSSLKQGFWKKFYSVVPALFRGTKMTKFSARQGLVVGVLALALTLPQAGLAQTSADVLESDWLELVKGYKGTSLGAELVEGKKENQEHPVRQQVWNKTQRARSLTTHRSRRLDDLAGSR